MRDVLLIAQFELFRAVRTWRAVALVLLYAVATIGAAYLFANMVGLAEKAMAESLGVAATEVPGAMMDDLLASESFQEVLTAMVGSSDVAERLMSVPLAAIFHLWLGFLIVPFFAASASAESIAIDMNNRAIRFEALRTSRMALVLGRFAGQLTLTGFASAVSALAMWGTVLYMMVVPEPVALLGWLGWYTVRTWCFAVPFVGFGVACSQWTTSAAWARVMAIGGTAGSWVLYGIAQVMIEEDWMPVVGDLVIQVLPQGWIRGMWDPGMGWIASCAVCVGLGLTSLLLGYVRFARRDL